MAIAMHCNLRPPDAAHAKFEVRQPICSCLNVYTADTLVYVVTLWPCDVVNYFNCLGMLDAIRKSPVLLDRLNAPKL